MEYPLYNCQGCPTARFVGGTSRFLCECPDPENCWGVRAARRIEREGDQFAKARTYIQARIAEGVAWLDSHNPGWWKLVHPGTLDMRECDQCMLGQLYRDFHNAYEEKIDKVEVAQYGFEVPWGDNYMEELEIGGHETYYALLTEEWRIAIIAARKERGKA